MASLTPYYGLSYFGGSNPGSITDDGAKFTGRDRLDIDRMLHALAVSSRHVAADGSIESPNPPALTLGTAGGLPGGSTFTYCVTFIDANGLESLPSDEVTISTPDVLAEPLDPGVADDELDGTSTGALPAGLYYYALTAVRDTEESALGVQTTITLDEPGGVALTMPTPPTGANQFQIWRMNAADVGWTRVAKVAATEGLTYTDDGSVAANTNADDPSQMPPIANLGLAVYSVVVDLEATDAALVTAGGVSAWRIYRTETPSAYPEDSLVHHVVDRNDPGDTGNPALPLLTTWIDEGDILTDGVPPLAAAQMKISPQTFEHVEALPDAALYPAWYPLIYNNQLYGKHPTLGWVLLSGSSGGSGEVVIFTQDAAITDWVIPHSFPYRPAVDIVDADGNRVEADVIHSAGVVTIHADIPLAGTAHLS